MRRPLLLVLIFATFQLSAQRLENIRAEAVNGGERVIITYDINGASGKKYKVAIYSSHNNYSSPLSMISGDVNEVTAGTGKRIEWNARAEMVEYNGDVTFEIRANPVAAALSVKTPSGVKKGKTATLTFEGSNPGENVRLDLIKSGVVVNQIGNTTDPARYVWTVPSDVAKGSDYQVRITTAGGSTATSGSFSVKSKTSPLVYIIPGVVVVGVVVFLVTSKKDKDGDDLPTPPEPTER